MAHPLNEPRGMSEEMLQAQTPMVSAHIDLADTRHIAAIDVQESVDTRIRGKGVQAVIIMDDDRHTLSPEYLPIACNLLRVGNHLTVEQRLDDTLAIPRPLQPHLSIRLGGEGLF